MKLGDEILKRVNKKFEPSTMVHMSWKGYDMAIRTDEAGNAIQLFLGKSGSEGKIKGDRYARTLKYDREGKLIKDHWERKGKAS